MPADETNSARFLTAFRRIERWLESNVKLRGIRGIDGFTPSVNAFAGRHSVVRRFRDDLRQFAELRNAIVHEYAGQKVIAEPNEWTVKRIEAIAQELIAPPRVMPHFQKQVVTTALDASISAALAALHEHDFSQLPVYHNGRCRGMLTGQTIARWLAAKVAEDVLSLDETTVRDVMSHAPGDKTRAASEQASFRFVDREASLFEVLDLFARPQSPHRLDAVLITQTGKATEALLGIITTWDLPQVHRLTALHSEA